MLSTILVPQGAEYRAVCRGVRAAQVFPTVIPLPVGANAVWQRLQALQAEGQFEKCSGILVAGLCGSLTSLHPIASPVLYQECLSLAGSAPALACDRDLTALLHEKLGTDTALVTALTSDRVICSTAEKQHLAQTYAATIVDMEGYAVLQVLGKLGVSVAMLRVVSDDCQHDLPDLTHAFGADGNLQTVPAAIAMLQQPIAAMRLIRGSLHGLKVLQTSLLKILSN